MSKTIFIDGVFTILHFNSSPTSFIRARQSDTFFGECCFCYSPIEIPPNDIGEQKKISCKVCNNKLTYFTIHLNNNLEKVLDVHFFEKSGINGIMHILLPPNHPEFDQFIKSPLFFKKPNMSNHLRFSHIMNTTIELFYNEIQERTRSKKYFLDAKNIVTIYDSISRFEKFIILGVDEKLHILDHKNIADAAKYLYKALLERYPANINDDEVIEINTNIIKTCLEICNSEQYGNFNETTQDMSSVSSKLPTSTQKEKPFEIKTIIKNIKALSFIDEDEIIIGGSNGKVGLWQISNGSQKKTYKLHTRQVLQAKRINKNYFTTSGEDGLICVWEKEKEEVDRYFDFDNYVKQQSYNLSNSNKSSVPIILPNIRNDFIILFPSGDSVFPPYLWKPGLSKIYLLGGSDKIPCGINTGSINNKGDCIVYTSNTAIIGYDIVDAIIILEFGGLPVAHLIDQKKNIMFYTDSQLVNNVAQRICDNHRKPITCIEFSKNDQLFATGSEDYSIRLWDFDEISIISAMGAENHPKPIVFNGLNHSVISIAFLENDELLLGASLDGTIIIWEISTKKIVKKITSTLNKITSFAISSERDKIAFGANDGLVQIISL